MQNTENPSPQFMINPIGHIRTPYKEKFAIPRQPGLVTSALGEIVFSDDYRDADMLRGIEQFSHLWLIFQFHQTRKQGWSSLVRPPRLGGNEKVGVFASRSTFRPNNLGLSLVELTRVDANHPSLWVKGIDLLDNTPIIDIKPYLPYSDSRPQAEAGYAQSSPNPSMPTTFSAEAQQQVNKRKAKYPELESFICEVLAQDPRPAYQQTQQSDRIYGVKLYDFNLRWQVKNGQNHVIELEDVYLV